LELENAKRYAARLKARLRPYCSRLFIVGSIRRGKVEVNDIDLLIIPSDHWGLNRELKILGTKIKGPKLSHFVYFDVPVDVYFADEESWANLLLIRTGSKENNIRLCRRARELGMKLKASGQGLIGLDGKVLKISSEKEIYQKLGMIYQPPGQR